jgi:hypothetical protein
MTATAAARLLVDGKLFPLPGFAEPRFDFRAGKDARHGHVVCWSAARWLLSVDVDGVCAVTREFRGMVTAEFPCAPSALIAVRLCRPLPPGVRAPAPMPGATEGASDGGSDDGSDGRPLLPGRAGIDHFADGAAHEWREWSASLSPMMRFLQKHKRRFAWDAAA